MTATCKYANGTCQVCGTAGKTVRACHANRMPAKATHAARLRPGTVLAFFFSKVGVRIEGSCSCKSVARIMDASGLLWCLKNTWEIAGKISANAKSRGKWCPIVVSASLVVLAVVASAAEGALAKFYRGNE